MISPLLDRRDLIQTRPTGRAGSVRRGFLPRGREHGDAARSQQRKAHPLHDWALQRVSPRSCRQLQAEEPGERNPPPRRTCGTGGSRTKGGSVVASSQGLG